MVPSLSRSRFRKICGNRRAALRLPALVVSALILVAPAIFLTGVSAFAAETSLKYALTLSTEEAAVNALASPLFTAEVTADGVPASDTKVVFTWQAEGDAPQPGKIAVVNDKGRASYRLKNPGGRVRTITVTAALEEHPAVTASASVGFELPEGFIALSNRALAPVSAEQFCRDQGGRLPRVNGSDSLPRGDMEKATSIEGFGAPGAPWPSGLPYNRYWTGTEFTGEPAIAGIHGGFWLIGVQSGVVRLHNEGRSVTYGVVCVP